MADQADAFGLFVSCVDGQPVCRYGTRTLIAADRIESQVQVQGGRLRPRGEITIVYRPDDVVAISHGEYSRYRREYDRALRDGSLVKRSVEDWRAQNRHASRTKREQGAGTPPAPDKAQE